MPPTLHEIYKHAVDLWRQIHPVWAGTAAAIAALTTAFIKFRAVKKWIVEKRDGKILRLLLEARRTTQVKMRPGQTVGGMNPSAVVPDIIGETPMFWKSRLGVSLFFRL